MWILRSGHCRSGFTNQSPDDLDFRPLFPTACEMKDLDSGGSKSAKTAGNLTSIFPTACGMKDLDSGDAKSAKTVGNLTSIFPTACERKDLDSGGAKRAKLWEIEFVYSRLLVKCRIWTLKVPKVQKLRDCVWNEGSGVWRCQIILHSQPFLPRTVGIFGPDSRSFIPHAVGNIEVRFPAVFALFGTSRVQILHSTRSREYRSFCTFGTSRVQILHSTSSREFRS